MAISCPVCNADNPTGNRFCNSCGSPLSGEKTTSSPTGDVERAATQTVCPRCQGINQAGSSYCNSCGLPLEGDIRSPSGTPASARPAGFWIRFVAWFIDLIILVAAQLALAAVWDDFAEYYGSRTVFDTETVAYYVLSWFTTYVTWVVSAIYYVVGVSVWSTTIGKKVFGTYVVRPDGSQVGPGRALARWLAYWLSFLLFFAGLLMIALRCDKRGLHDLICDTVVVER